jgi:hypothetical protein
LSCRRLSPARDVDEERVSDVDQNQADSICPPCRERPGGAIADEAQLSNRRFDLEAGVFAHQVGIVEHIGHRANRHTSVPSDILNARPSRSRVAIIGLPYPGPRLCHVGRLYLDP